MQIIYSLYRATKIAKKSMQQHNVFNPEWILYLGILKKVKSMIFIGNYSTFQIKKDLKRSAKLIAFSKLNCFFIQKQKN